MDSRIATPTPTLQELADRLEQIENLLKPYPVTDYPAAPNLDLIINLTAAHYGLSRAQLFGNARPNVIVIPRMIMRVLALEFSSLTENALSKILRCDHATIAHSLAFVAEQLPTMSAWAPTLEPLRQKIQAALLAEFPASTQFSESLDSQPSTLEAQ